MTEVIVKSGILNQVQQFIFSNQFWQWHGFVLSGLWVIVSALAILAKRFSTIVHLSLFFIVDVTTVFFAGSALYRVSAGFGNFNEWSTLKKCHVLGGAFFLVVIFIQHLGGAISFHTNKPNPVHRKLGRYIAILGRIIAAFGWILGGNQQNAIIVAVASVVILIISAILPTSKPSKQAKLTQSSTERSKSPRSKRQ